MPDLAILVPTRGRPDNVRKVLHAWDFTRAWDRADLILIIDEDDPRIDGYRDVVSEDTSSRGPTHVWAMDRWMPMVHKLNQVAAEVARGGKYRALGFAGDDHVPRTIGWATEYLAQLGELGTGMVYGDDGYQGRKLGTEWAVTNDVVRVLGRMVPADVEHMYCDNSILDLFTAVDRVRYLPHVRIEHMHPVAGKADRDDQYRKVNSHAQFQRDRSAYERWKRTEMADQVAEVKRLIGAISSPSPVRASRANRKVVAKVSDMRIPKGFRKVRAATPDKVGMALAGMAAQVDSSLAIVELGVFQAWTTLMMAWGASQGLGAHVWGVDPWDSAGNTYGPPFTDPGSRHWARYNVNAQGYRDRVTLIQAFSADQAKVWDKGPIGLLFIDGDHSYQGCRDDIVLWSKHLAEGATIAVDDYGHADWPGVAQAVDELVAEGFIEPITVMHGELAVTRLAASDPEELDVPDPEELDVPDPEELDVPDPEELDVPDPEEFDVPDPDLDPEELDSDSEELAVPVPDSDLEELAVLNPDPHWDRQIVQEGEMHDVPAGVNINVLTRAQLCLLAAHRGIVVGLRRNKRSEVIQALIDGK